MAKIIKTKMLTRYIVKLVLRITIFLTVLTCYILFRSKINDYLTRPFFDGIKPTHFLWVVFIGIMLCHIFPFKQLSMALRKKQAANFVIMENYSKDELKAYVKHQDRAALIVMVIWLAFNSIFGVLHIMNILNKADMLMLTTFFFLCDYICILFFCPFRTFIMKNKCCINCRIYDWGHFMMFTPMLFLRDFFGLTLFGMSLLVLINWELVFRLHPERFWSGSNKTIQCASCQDRTCQMKNKIKAIQKL